MVAVMIETNLGVEVDVPAYAQTPLAGVTRIICLNAVGYSKGCIRQGRDCAGREAVKLRTRAEEVATEEVAADRVQAGLFPFQLVETCQRQVLIQCPGER